MQTLWEVVWMMKKPLLWLVVVMLVVKAIRAYVRARKGL